MIHGIGCAGGAAFLCQDRVPRIGLAQRRMIACFRLAVDLRDEIVRRLFLTDEEVEVAVRAIDDAAGAACGFHRDVEHRMQLSAVWASMDFGGSKGASILRINTADYHGHWM